MTGQCRPSGRMSHRLARRLSKAVGSILPGALLVLLPKCPSCLAAWLTVVTGVRFPIAGVVWVREVLMVCWVAAMALAAAFGTRGTRSRPRLTGLDEGQMVSGSSVSRGKRHSMLVIGSS